MLLIYFDRVLLAVAVVVTDARVPDVSPDVLYVILVAPTWELIVVTDSNVRLPDSEHVVSPVKPIIEVYVPEKELRDEIHEDVLMQNDDVVL